jgi:hypothetical protein
MQDTRVVFFDPETVEMLREVLDDTWSRLPAGQTKVTRSELAERILKAVKPENATPPSCGPTRSQKSSRAGCRAGRYLMRSLASLRLDHDLVANILDIAV